MCSVDVLPARGTGEIMTEEHLTCKRPGFGLPPSWMDRVVGLRAARDIEQDEVLELDSVDWEKA